MRAFLNNPGSDLLSRKLYRHYHRPCGVSRPCSEWERVGPPRQDHREIFEASALNFHPRPKPGTATEHADNFYVKNKCSLIIAYRSGHDCNVLVCKSRFPSAARVRET